MSGRLTVSINSVYTSVKTLQVTTSWTVSEVAADVSGG